MPHATFLRKQFSPAGFGLERMQYMRIAATNMQGITGTNHTFYNACSTSHTQQHGGGGGGEKVRHDYYSTCLT